MIIDEKGKLFGKISIIDIAVVLVIILAVLGGIVMYNHTESKKISSTENSLITDTNNLSDICVEFQLSNIRDITKKAISINDKIYSADTGKYIGEIIRIDSKPFRNTITGTDGTMVFADVPEKYDLTLYVKVSGRQTDMGFYSSENTHFAVGDAMTIKTETVKTSPIIKKVYAITEENADKFNDETSENDVEESENKAEEN